MLFLYFICHSSWIGVEFDASGWNGKYLGLFMLHHTFITSVPRMLCPRLVVCCWSLAQVVFPIIQHYLIGNGANIRSPQCQSTNLNDPGDITQYKIRHNTVHKWQDRKGVIGWQVACFTSPSGSEAKSETYCFNENHIADIINNVSTIMPYLSSQAEHPKSYLRTSFLLCGVLLWFVISGPFY